MSGGVDSTTAAAKLVKEGFQVVGVTMKLWEAGEDEEYFESGCCSVKDAHDARMAAAKLGFRHFTLDLRRTFQDSVIEDFIAEYRAGRTPNPCIRCNSFLKWEALWERKNSFGLEFLATGHYARIRETDDGIGLFKAIHLQKDQSYALWGLPREKLAKTIFPLGDMEKSEVRCYASELGLRVADKAESQEICFIPDNNYGKFLEKKGIKPVPGDIIDHEGRVIGTHSGIIYYTIGQRKGLGGGFDQPMYVNRIDSDSNKIYIGPREQVVFKDIEIHRVNWLVGEIPTDNFEAEVKIRYADKGSPAEIEPVGKDKLRIHFPAGVSAPTPGQSAVLYVGERLIAGGVILSAA